MLRSVILPLRITGREKPPIDKLVFSITPDASVRYAKLKAGECQVMPFPNPADLAAMKADPDINLMQKEGFERWLFGLQHPKSSV